MNRKKMIESLLKGSHSLDTYFLDHEGLLEAADRLETWVEYVTSALTAAGMVEQLKIWNRANDARCFSPGASWLDVDWANYNSDLNGLRAVLIGFLDSLERGESARELLPAEGEAGAEAELASLYRRLAEEQENLLLMEERKSEHVMDTATPLDLIKQERRTQKRIEDLKRRIGELEQPTSGGLE